MSSSAVQRSTAVDRLGRGPEGPLGRGPEGGSKIAFLEGEGVSLVLYNTGKGGFGVFECFPYLHLVGGLISVRSTGCYLAQLISLHLVFFFSTICI